MLIKKFVTKFSLEKLLLNQLSLKKTVGQKCWSTKFCPKTNDFSENRSQNNIGQKNFYQDKCVLNKFCLDKCSKPLAFFVFVFSLRARFQLARLFKWSYPKSVYKDKCLLDKCCVDKTNKPHWSSYVNEHRLHAKFQIFR